MENEWISVEDRLPDPTDDISSATLEMLGSGENPTGWPGLYYSKDGCVPSFCAPNGKYRIFPTHWRPLATTVP